MKFSFNRDSLEELYRKYNRKAFIHPDPLEFVHRYSDPVDREVVAWVASSLAYGRVQQILRSVSEVLERMGSSPGRFLLLQSPNSLKALFKDFRHRFTTGSELAGFLGSIGDAIRRYGSLEACLLSGYRADDADILPALTHFVEVLQCGCGNGPGSMFLPTPLKGSACKRLHLFLRWMVRKDEVDLGVWKNVDRAKLIVPLDTHMFRIAREFQLTNRKQADMRAALEITMAFRTVCPEDPVKYDFALTRPGIRRE
jgi:uncharacterized protein (TIGR02757 family)